MSNITPINQAAAEATSRTELQAVRREGAACASRLGGTADKNPHEAGTEESKAWANGFLQAATRLNDLFLAWLALGHSIPKLAVGSAGQALGPMVAGLIQSNGNTAGALLVGALASHAGKPLSKVLPSGPDQVRQCFEATQYAITGHEMPPEWRGEIAEFFFTLACEIDAFREPGSETEVETPDGENKVARVKFDLASYLRALVEGLPMKGGDNGKSD